MRISIYEDMMVNKRNYKALIFLISFRILSPIYQRRFGLLPFVLCIPLFILHRICFEWVLAMEIPLKTKIGPGLIIYHGFGIVVHDKSILGSNVILRHGVTIGMQHLTGEAPIVGDGVEFGASSTVLGPVRIGNNVTIGAGSIVTKDVPDSMVVTGVNICRPKKIR